MSGGRLGIGLRDGAAVDVRRVAATADRLGIDGLWILGTAHDVDAGDTLGSGALATASACAAVTADLRLTVQLSPAGRVDVLHAAEDLGVLDRASGGRSEALLAAPPGGGAHVGWGDLASAWDGWRTGSGAVVAVTPRPVQPFLPWSVLDDEDLARALGVPVVIASPPHPGSAPVPRRAVLHPAGDLVDPTDEATALERALAARAVLQAAGAPELVLVASGVLTATALRWAATVVAPALRCDDRELDHVVPAAVRWWRQAPAPAGERQVP